MPITAPPTIPQITDPSTFATRAQDWVVWQANELYPALEEESLLLGLSLSGTSVTSNIIGTGSKSFTTQTGKGFAPGQSLVIARTSVPTNRMFAVVASYNSGTGALVVTSQAVEGSGTFTDWTISPTLNAVLTLVQIPDGLITQAKLSTNIAATGAAFSAVNTSNQSVTSGVVTKVTLDSELFDTNNNFASSRFTPTVAGYYQINGQVRGFSATLTACAASLYVNGSLYRQGGSINIPTYNGGITTTVSEVIYLNGTTDYVELYGVAVGGTPTFSASGGTNSAFSGVLVRAA